MAKNFFDLHASAQHGRFCATIPMSSKPLVGFGRNPVPGNATTILCLFRCHERSEKNDRYTFAPVKNKPRVIEEHDGMTSVVSAVEAGNGVAVAVEALGYAFGNRVKLVRLTPEPKPISFGIAARKGRLSPAAEKFWQCAREAASKK